MCGGGGGWVGVRICMYVCFSKVSCFLNFVPFFVSLKICT